MSSPQSYASMWQESVPEIAWGTIWLFLGILISYAAVLCAALADVMPYPLAGALLGFIAFSSFTVMHEAGHGNIFKMGSVLKPLETIMGWIASIPFLVLPYRLFQKIHDRHHAFTNDPHRDPDYFNGPHTWYGVILNAFWVPIHYHIMSVTELRNIKQFKKTYASTLIYLALAWGTLIFLCINGYALEVISLLVAPQLIAVFLLVMFFDFIPHFPHATLGRYQNTNIYGGKWLNIFLFGQNQHLIHHMFPRLPWYKYRQVFQRLKPDLEANDAPLYDSLFPSFSLYDMAGGFQRAGDFCDMQLQVSAIKRLTADASAIRFANPAGPALKYSAGQYITVSKWMDGEQQTRCYSLCTPPESNTLEIGVKAIDGGRVSSFINLDLRVGDKLIVRGPFGKFVYPPAQKIEIEALQLIAGGSGITPIKAILEVALADESIKTIHLLYANRSPSDVMFFPELEELQVSHQGRLKVTHIFATAPAEWSGARGLLTADMLSLLLELDNAANTQQAFYICGPQGLKNLVASTLSTKGVAEQRVFIEEFVASATPPVGELFPVEIALANGQTKTIKVASNQTVLEVAKAQGVSIPHACCVGTCGTCKIKITSGETAAIADAVSGILATEQLDGFTLACQCRPLSALKLQEDTTY